MQFCCSCHYLGYLGRSKNPKPEFVTNPLLCEFTLGILQASHLDGLQIACINPKTPKPQTLRSFPPIVMAPQCGSNRALKYIQ